MLVFYRKDRYLGTLSYGILHTLENFLRISVCLVSCRFCIILENFIIKILLDRQNYLSLQQNLKQKLYEQCI